MCCYSFSYHEVIFLQSWLERNQGCYQEPGLWIPPSRTRTSSSQLGKVAIVAC